MSFSSLMCTTMPEPERNRVPAFHPQGDLMSKSQDAKKNVKKPPTKTPKEKKEAKRIKKAGR